MREGELADLHQGFDSNNAKRRAVLKYMESYMYVAGYAIIVEKAMALLSGYKMEMRHLCYGMSDSLVNSPLGRLSPMHVCHWN